MPIGEKLSDGKLFIDGVEFTGISDASLTLEPSEEYADDVKKYSIDNHGKFECELYSSIPKLLLHYLSGYLDFILRFCTNRKVVHKARYAKKYRTRKKNFNRAQKIIYKELKRGGLK